MRLDQFTGGLNRWGAALAQWPEGERAAAMTLLQASAEARDAMAEAVRVEAFMQAHDPACALGPGALVRMMNSVMARLPAAAPPRRSTWTVVAERLGLGGAGREWAPRFAMSTAVAVMLGLLVGTRLSYDDSHTQSPLEALAMSIPYVPLDLR